MKLIFEWDARKAQRNLKSHKVSFDEAKTLFNDPFLITYPDEFHSEIEDRLISIGYSESSVAEKPLLLRGKPMKKKSENQDNMLPEYDFTSKKGVRGQYYHAYRQGHTVKIHEEDGTITTHYFTLEEGAVMLDPDVREYFPDSESVNKALRGLIALVPQKPTHQAVAVREKKTRYSTKK